MAYTSYSDFSPNKSVICTLIKDRLYCSVHLRSHAQLPRREHTAGRNLTVSTPCPRGILVGLLSLSGVCTYLPFAVSTASVLQSVPGLYFTAT